VEHFIDGFALTALYLIPTLLALRILNI